MDGGRIIRVILKTQFEYSYLDASGSQDVTIVRALDLRRYQYASVLTRVHGANIQGGSFSLTIAPTDPSPFDQQVFADTSVASTQTFSTGQSSPALVKSDLTNFGPYMLMVLTATQGGTNKQRLWLEISIDVWAKVG